MWRGRLLLTLWALFLGAHCVASPLPEPPSVEPGRMHLVDDGQDNVQLSGDPGTLTDTTSLTVTNLVHDVTVTAALGPDDNGAFFSLIRGRADHYYRLVLTGPAGELRVVVTTDGAGGVLLVTGDADGDGFPAPAAGGPDCDDADPTVHPGAIDVCGDHVDNDCDGMIDELCHVCATDADCGMGAICMAGVCNVAPGACVTHLDCVDMDTTTVDYCDPMGLTCHHDLCMGHEICGDHLDNDCNGVVDDHIACP